MTPTDSDLKRETERLAKECVAKLNGCTLDDVGEFATDIYFFKEGFEAAIEHKQRSMMLSDGEAEWVSRIEKYEAGKGGASAVVINMFLHIINRLTARNGEVGK